MHAESGDFTVQENNMTAIYHKFTGNTDRTKLYENRHEKTCLRRFRPGKTQTGLLSYRDKLETGNFGYRN